MDLERQASLIKEFSLKAAEASLPEQLADIVRDATSDRYLILYSEMLSFPTFFKLAGTEHESSLDVLRLFAFGTWIDYQRNAQAYPALVPRQIEKLKQLHLITLMQSSKDLKYDVLQRELGFSDVEDLQRFLQFCRTSGNIKFRPNALRKKIVIESNAKDLLNKVRGEVITGKSFDVFLQEAAALHTNASGVICNGIVRLVRVPVDEQGKFILSAEFQLTAGRLFAMLVQHVTTAHSDEKSFGGKIYPGMFIVVGNELFLREEAAPTKPLTNDNSKLDYGATETIFKDNTALRVVVDGEEISLYPLYWKNFSQHLRCDTKVLSKHHIDFPMVKALDKNYTTFLRCHAIFQSTSAQSVVLVHVRSHHKYTSQDNKGQFLAAMRTAPTSDKWQKPLCTQHPLFLWTIDYARKKNISYERGPVGRFVFIRDWDTHVGEHLTESQKLIFTAAVRRFLIEHFFTGFYPEIMYKALCLYRVKHGKFDFKGWLESLLRVSKTVKLPTTMEWNLLGLHGLRLLNSICLKQLGDQFLRAIKKLDETEKEKPSNHLSLAKWRVLNNLRDQNLTVYYKVLIDNFEEFSSIIYMPTVGIVSQNPSCMFQRTGAMHISKEDAGDITSIVQSWSPSQVDMIVVTDGSDLSSINDIGVESAGVVMGKADLYVAAAGINPQRVLPVIIDVGTNCQRLLDDPLYHGIKELRLKEEECSAIINEFMMAVSSRWKSVVVQFEHIQSNLAFQLLKRYKNSHPVFDDDIQGATIVIIAGLLGAVRAQRRPMSDLAKQKIVIAVADSGGPNTEVVNAVIGIMQMIAGNNGTAFHSARKQLWIVDTKGLITENRSSIDPDLHHIARKRIELSCEGLSEGASFINVVKLVKPDVVLLLDAVIGLSSQKVIQTIKDSSSRRPAIFAMSSSRCTAEEIFTTFGEKVVFASTDQFPNMDLGNGKMGFSNYMNKIYLYPGIALGTYLSGAHKISDGMLYAAAICLASLVKAEDVVKGILYPPISSIRDITKKVAAAVLREAAMKGLSQGCRGMDVAELASLSEEQALMYVEDYMWSPT